MYKRYTMSCSHHVDADQATPMYDEVSSKSSMNQIDTDVCKVENNEAYGIIRS